MFWDNFVKLCAGKNIKPNPLAKELGISSGAVTKWKKEGTIPNRVTLQKIADYFGVSVDFLLNDSDSTTSSILSKKEKLLIENYKQLNEEGKEKLISYSDDLVSSGKYIKSNINEMDKEA